MKRHKKAIPAARKNELASIEIQVRVVCTLKEGGGMAAAWQQQTGELRLRSQPNLARDLAAGYSNASMH